VKIFQAASAEDFLAGTFDGLSLGPGGYLSLATRVEKVADLDEPFLFSAAALPKGWAVGTGNDGKVFRIDEKGASTLLFDATEPEVFALWADPDGTLFAGTSPQGKVYRIPPGGKAEPFFDPASTYIWAIRRAADGALLVATGTEGKLFRVDAKGKGTVILDTEATHVKCLLPMPDGSILAGTAGDGLVLKIDKDGMVRTLYDAREPEISALAASPDGTIYAAVVASEASLVQDAAHAGKPGAAAPPAGGPPAVKGEGTPVVTVTVGEGDSGGGGGHKDSGPHSEVVAIAPSGAAETVGSFSGETVFDLLWQDRLWVATGLEGKLYSLRSGRMQVEKDTEERQLVALLPGAAGPVIAATNAATLYRTTAKTETDGTYTSAVLDAQTVARFGVLRWRGEAQPGATVAFSFRSGMSATPDRTWGAWSPAVEGHEIAVPAAAARYVQWRVELKGQEGSSPRLRVAELSYRQENQKPKIEAFGSLPPGQILVPANFNPTNQVFEPVHPNREGIFTAIAPADDADEGSGRLKPLWKLGYRSLRWKASDPNGDALRYRLTFRPAEAEGAWLPLAEDLKDDYYGFDIASLPDGLYRFRLEASDAKANDPGQGLAAEEVSPAVVVDHSPPALGKVRREGKRLLVTLEDSLSPIRAVESSA